MKVKKEVALGLILGLLLGALVFTLKFVPKAPQSDAAASSSTMSDAG